VTEDLGHVFVKPFEFIPGSKGKILILLPFELKDLLALVLDPFQGAYGRLGGCFGGHFVPLLRDARRGHCGDEVEAWVG
jgi:hypothetical protein